MSIKVVCCLYYQFLHAKQPWRKLVSGFSFACNKHPPQFINDKSNDSSIREGMPLDALNWFGRGYELHTPKSIGREGSKAWALSVVPHFSLSPHVSPFLAWGDFHARSCFACSTIPEEKWGTTRSLYVFPQIFYHILFASMLLHFALVCSNSYCTVHFALMLHFAVIITFCGVTLSL